MSVLATLWSAVSYIWPFLFVLSLVVFFHELGHFLVGRLCGVKADVFSLGFGPELFGFNDRYGTHWRVAALPLGGYVKFYGETQEAAGEAAAAMPAQERAVSFFAQKLWKRAAIVAAGPLANFVLAIAIYTGVFYGHGRSILSPVIDSVAADSAAEAAGFLPGDRILSIDGTKIDSFEDMQRIVQAASGTPLTFVVERDGKTVDLVATPRLRDLKTRFGSERVAVIGVKPKIAPQNWHLKKYGFFDSVKLAGTETGYVVTRTGAYLGGLISGQQPADELSGPVRIAEVSGAMAKIGFVALLHLAAALSISIGMLNLLPVPLLDGGHLAYYAIEAVRGKAVDEKVQQFGINIGLALLASLMVFVTYNDILQLIRQQNPIAEARSPASGGAAPRPPTTSLKSIESSQAKATESSNTIEPSKSIGSSKATEEAKTPHSSGTVVGRSVAGPPRASRPRHKGMHRRPRATGLPASALAVVTRRQIRRRSTS